MGSPICFNVSLYKSRLGNSVIINIDYNLCLAFQDANVPRKRQIGLLHSDPSTERSRFLPRTNLLRREHEWRLLHYQHFIPDATSLPPEQRELVERFSRALINKIGHMPVSRLKSAPNPEKALHYQEILRDLFDLENSEKQ